MSLNSESRRNDQMEFTFDLTFEKVLHIPKRASEIQVLWTEGKLKGSSSIATVIANVATWEAGGNSISVTSTLFKEPESSFFMLKNLILELVAVQNKKIISTLSYCMLNLADYVELIADPTRPTSSAKIQKKMTQGCVACFLVSVRYLRAKSGEWKPERAKTSGNHENAKNQGMQAEGGISSTTEATKMLQESQFNMSRAVSKEKNLKVIGHVDDHASVYIGDAGIELLLRIFSKYDRHRNGYFHIEEVACMLSEIGQHSVADDLRSGKTALAQNLDTFSCIEDESGSSLQMNFSSFVSWISVNKLASKLHVARSIREATKESVRDNHAAHLSSDRYVD